MDSAAPVHDAGGTLIGVVLVFQDRSEHYAFEKELTASEAKYRTLTESAPDAILVESEGRFAYLNPAAQRLFGIESPEELLGRPFIERTDPARLDSIRACFRKLHEAREPVEQVEETVVSMSGEFIPVDCSAVPIEYGAKPSALIFMRDTRLRKSAEAALAHQYAMLARTERMAKVGSWEWDFTRDEVRWSDEMFRIFGLSPAEGAPRFVEHTGLFVAEDCARLREAVAACIAAGTPCDMELRAIRADGTIRHCVVNGQADRDASGKIQRLVGSLQDITERRQAEEQQKRLSAAIEQAVETIIITDAECIIEYVNPAFERTTGYSRDEVIGQKTKIVEREEQDAAFQAAVWETISSGRVWQGQLVSKRKDGILYTEEATISPVFDAAGQIINYVAVKHDISDRVRMEAEREQLQHQILQAQKMESVGRLAGGVAHDFNNMLSVILGYAEMAMNELDPATPLYADLLEISNTAKRSAEITQQLLAFARRQTISPRVLDLNETVEGMLKMLRRLIGEDIDLAWLPALRLWPVKLDPAQVNQILANLCINARDAIGGVGKIVIETENVTFDEAYCVSHPEAAPGDFIQLAVSDNGAGMDAETCSQIFEPFFTTKGLGEGTGLGLATIYGIVKQNNGFISVYSEPGQGTTFHIYLARHGDELTVPQERVKRVVEHGHGEIILLVEDDPLILKLGRRMLENLGYQVLTAPTPKDALELARARNCEIHLVMSDVVMPGMNGRELIEQIQIVCPSVPTLYMSGYTADVIADRGVLEEGVNFIQKPFSIEELAAGVHAAMTQE